MVATDAFRAKVEAGVGATVPSGASFRLTGTYDGIGVSDYHAYSTKLDLSVPIR